MEKFLKLFEEAIRKQAQLVGDDVALTQAKRAGLGVSPDGRIISCAGNPQVALLRLIRYFSAGGNLSALMECVPLINELLKEYPDGEFAAETDFSSVEEKALE